MQKLLKHFLVFFAVSVCFSVQAEVVSSTDAGKKTMAKFMLNLAKFVDWPDNKFASSSAPIQFCMMGGDPMGSFLSEVVDGSTANDRGVEVKQLGLADVSSAESCHVVFINVASAEEATSVIDGLEGKAVLTVGEAENFAQYGGMVGFYGEGRKVALAINKGRLEGAGLNASSRLYRASTM